MTNANVTENQYKVTVSEGVTTVVTAKAPGPQGADAVLQAGNRGDFTVSVANNGAQTAVINSGAVTSAKILDGAIVNADINASAAIAGSKIIPQFNNNIVINTVFPQVWLNDTDSNSDFKIINANGTFTIEDSTKSADRLTIDSDGIATFTQNLNANDGLDVTGNISVSGTVDSVDLSTYQADGGSYLRSDADDSFTGTIIGNSDSNNPVIQINGGGPNFIRFDSGSNTPSDSIDLVYRTTPNTLAFERASDSQIMFSVDADDQQAIFNGNVDCNAGLDVSGGDITGTLGSGVTGTTQSASDNSTKIATTSYVDTAVSNLVNEAPNTLDTLNELAAALGDNPNFATTVTNSIGDKLPLAGGTLTGDLTISTTAPLIKFDETDQTTDYFIVANNNILTLARNNLNSPNHIQKWNADGHVDFLTNVDFASGIDVTGDINGTGDLFLTADTPKIRLIDNNADDDFQISNFSGNFIIKDITNNVDRFTIASDGTTTVANNLNVGAGIDVTGNITLPDNGQLQLGGGTNGDLKIYHDTLNSYIQETGTGNLFIDASFFTFRSGAGDTVATFSHGTGNAGGCRLHYGGGSTPKLITTATGVDVDGNLTISSTSPNLIFTDTNNDSDFTISVENGSFRILDASQMWQSRFIVYTDGTVEIPSNLDCGAGIDVTGDVTSTTGFAAGTTSVGTGVRFLAFSNNTSIGHQIKIEQDGEGDAVLGWSLTGTRAWSAGIDNSDSNKWKLSSGSSVDSNTQITIEQDGYVGLHHDSASTPKLQTSATGVDVTGNLLVENNTGNNFTISTKVGNANDSHINFYKSRGGSSAATIVEDGDDLGTIHWRGYDGSDYEIGAYIKGDVSGTPAIDDIPTKLIFGTRAAGDSSATTRMTIQSDGRVNITDDLAVNTDALYVKSADKRIGIGTTSPNTKIHIVSNGASWIRLTDADVTAETDSLVGGIDFTTTDSNNAGKSAQIAAYHEDQAGNAYLRFDTGNASSTPERMRIKSDGTIVTSGAIEFPSTLASYDPTQDGNGTETSTKTVISLMHGHQIAVNRSGYIRNIFKIDTESNGSHIEVGRSNTGYVGDIKLLPGTGGKVIANYDGSPKLETSSTGITVEGSILATGHLRNDVPADYWNTGTHVHVNDVGTIGTHGSYEFTLTSGGYRRQVNNVGKWKDITVDGQSGFGCQIGLSPKTGKIHLRSNSGLSTDDNNPSPAGLTDRLVVSTTGVDVTGKATMTESNASSSNDLRKITTSTAQPSGGADGDIWIVVPS